MVAIAPSLTRNWCLGDRPDLGAFNTLNRLVRTLAFSDQSALPNLGRGNQLVVASDYSGQHATAQFESFAFVIAEGESLLPCLDEWRALRTTHLPDNRRMSYKNLGDRARRAALSRFLSATDCIEGLLLVVLVDKRTGALFTPIQQDTHVDPALVSAFSIWRTNAVERLLRICHLMSLFLSGLTRSGQNVLWITDQDDIAANEDRHRTWVRAFQTISSHYLEHALGHLRLATTASDTGSRQLEDLVAVADLSAGAVGHALDSYGFDGIQGGGLFVPPPTNASAKSRLVMDWFSDCRSRLRRLVLSIEPGSTAAKLRVRHIAFHGSASHGIVCG